MRLLFRLGILAACLLAPSIAAAETIATLIAALPALADVPWVSTSPAPVPAGPMFMPHPVAPAPVSKPQWHFPAMSTAKAPEQSWLPGTLSAQDRAYRMAADRALIRSEAEDGRYIENVALLQDELKQERYDTIESQLSALLKRTLADPSYELVLRDLAPFADDPHAHGSWSDIALIEAWVRARPQSPWAHYAKGHRWDELAWEARGSGWAQDVTEKQWKAFHEDEAKARAETKAALKLEPKLIAAWSQLILIDRADADLDHVSADYQAAMRQVPTSYLVPDTYLETLQPRWLGSVEMMESFAQSQLKQLDRNPRFWDLQAESLADRGCSACNDYDWGVSLKFYNAALTYADRPSWLAQGGLSAFHLRRYALAHAYYERALAYKQDFQWQLMRDFMVELCDPSKTAAEVEAYRKDMVKYGGIQDIGYPKDADSCIAYRSELPWSDEPLPDVTGVKPYAVDPLGHPQYIKEPSAISLPAQGKSVTAPDGSWKVSVIDEPGGKHRLDLLDVPSGHVTSLLEFTRSARMGWTSDAKHLYVTDEGGGWGASCLVVDPHGPGKPVDLAAEIGRQMPGDTTALHGFQVTVSCSTFINDDIVMANLTAYNPTAKVSQNRQFRYDATDKILYEWRPGQ